MRILIVDDNMFFRKVLITFLSKYPQFEIIGEAGNGKEVLEMLETHPAELVIMDIQMPVMDGIEATRRAMKLYPNLKIIGLSMYIDNDYFLKMKEAGVKGYLMKNRIELEMLDVINQVQNGGFYFS